MATTSVAGGLAAGWRKALYDGGAPRHPSILLRNGGLKAIQDLRFTLDATTAQAFGSLSARHNITLSTDLEVPAEPQFDPLAHAVTHK